MDFEPRRKGLFAQRMMQAAAAGGSINAITGKVVDPKDKSAPVRVDFIVTFVWKEPVQ
jgi:hypothetical protein